MFKNSTRVSFESEWKYRKGAGWSVIIVIEVVILVAGFLFGLFLDYDKDTLLIWALTPIVMIIAPFVLIHLAKKSIKEKMQSDPSENENVVRNFVFTETEMLVTSLKHEQKISSISVKYEDIKKIEENKNMLYIHIEQDRILFLNAEGMTEGTFDKLTNFLYLKCSDERYISI